MSDLREPPPSDAAADDSRAAGTGREVRSAPSELDVVRRKAERMQRARRSTVPLWRHLAQVGALGWLFVLPVLLLAWLGRLLAHTTGVRLLAVAGLLAGTVLGAYLVWRSVRRSLEDGEHSDSLDAPQDQEKT